MDHKTLQIYTTPILQLSDEDLSLLAGCAMSRELKKGETLLKEGEVCRSFYLVEKGYLRTYYNKDVIAINLNFTFEGDFTTNFKSFRSRQASEINIKAGEDALVCIFSLNSIVEQFGEYTQIMRFLRRLAIGLLLASEEYSDLFKIYTPTERYRYIEKNNPKLLQRISLSQMASYLGVTRETLSRIRAKKY
jgi:CRP-like cAMP-binding protein